jgi:hypothetical protein
MELDFSRHIFVKNQINFIKIHPVVADLFHADGRTDRQTGKQIEGHEGNSRFWQFCEST